jgi:uncharacterized protein YjbI with pentapeptide repeats
LQFGNFAGGYIKYSKLHNAILIGANLENANLRGADMSGSNLAGASVRGVDLSYANLRDAHLFQDELWEQRTKSRIGVRLGAWRRRLLLGSETPHRGFAAGRSSLWER